MKPLQLTMTAFGPFGGECEISFEQMGTHGIFLISGDTGAGKTTIFDGICFALFGEASGDTRKTDSLRSGYAKEDTATQVRLIFLHRGERYEIVRNPEYMRQSKRGNGMTPQKQDALLLCPDGSQVSGFRQVSAAIIQLLGVDKNQFKQISMIAQGEFMKLLNASSEDRGKIFRNVFNTMPHYQLQLRLGQLERELAGMCKDFDKSMSQYLMGVEACEDSKFYMQLQQGKDSGNLELIQELLPDLVDEGKSLAALAKSARESLGSKVKVQEELLHQQESVKEQLKLNEENQSRGREEVRKLEEQLQELHHAATQLLDLKDANTLMSHEIMEEEKVLPEYTLREEHRKEKIRLEETQSKLEAAGKTLAGELKELSEKSQQAASRSQELADIPVQLERLTLKQQSLEEQTKRFELTRDLLDKIAVQEQSLEDMQARVIQLEQEYANARDAYHTMELSYYHQQAGILASHLTEGEPCPVCGSTNHPQKAKLEDEAVTKEQLDAAKQAEESAQSIWQQEIQACTVKKGEIQTLQGRIPVECLPYEDKFALFKTETEAVAQNLQSMKEKDSQRIQAVGLVQQCEQKIQEDTTKLEENRKALHEIELQLRVIETKLKEQSNQLRYPDEDTARVQLEEKKCKHEKYQNDVSTTETKQQQCQQNLAAKRGQLEEQSLQHEALEQKLLESATLDVDMLTAELADMKLQQAHQDELYLSYHAIWTENEKIRQNVVALVKEQGKTRERYLMVKSLSETANGTLSGKDKVDFEKYVQGFYFKRVVWEANKRLRLMSGGQYELRCRESASDKVRKSGLELEIMDYYIGALRSVGSLSGGESFKAALALALGMSDVMQSTAGGIEIDAMFIDEGFGSLDSTSLEQAIEVLMQLAHGNRMVGIISHVAELKERIERKIEITRNSEGSSCRISM